MKKIGICTFTVNSNLTWDEENYQSGGITSGEIWAINIANEFVKQGYEVTLYGNPKYEHVSKQGVKYFKMQYLIDNISSLNFDYFISSRFIFPELKDVKAIKKILMLHDMRIFGCNNFDDIKSSGISLIGYQSEYQKNIVQHHYLIPEPMFFKTVMGFDSQEYKIGGVEKKNKMVFYGGKEKGLYWFMNHIFLKIKEAVPDFEVDFIENGIPFNEIVFKTEGVNIISNCTSDELKKKQMESKIWIYANHGYDNRFNTETEVFCNELIENILAGNACIISRWGCCKDILPGCEEFVGNSYISNYFEPIDYDRIEDFGNELVKEAIKCLQDEEYRVKKVKNFNNFAQNYTWENAYKSFEIEFNKINEFEKLNSMKILLCCIGRQENAYIREFIDFYKHIGVTKICLCDNNRDGEENFEDAIDDYIKSGFVILKNYRNLPPPVHLHAYTDCYKEYKNDYDWFLFFDIDEFMFINQDNSLQSFLSRKEFNDFNKIHINWLNFGDSGQLRYVDAPILQRLTQPIDVNSKSDYDFPDNFHIKSIVRGGLDYCEFNLTHTPKTPGRCCNANGVECNPNSPFVPYDYRVAGIRHFTTKTAEEYADKVNRGFGDINRDKLQTIERFFKRNEVTKEKVEIFKEKCGIDVSYLLPIEFTGEKNKDVQIYSLCYEKKNFQFLNDSVITPLQVGASNGSNVCELKDNTLDNISDKNYFFIEGTGTYWIWKNVKDAKYKGQMQYRRPLSGISENTKFEEIFKDYDVITCKPFNHPENSKPTKENPMCIPAQTVEGGYGFSNCLDDLLVLEMAIKMYHPEYTEDYDKYIKNGENLYYSNGFILKAEDFDRYSEFLFDCLNRYLEFTNIKNQQDLINHVKYNLEVGKYIRYNENEKRDERVLRWQCEIGGFLSERIWTLWLQHNFNKDRIYELPYIKMENNMYT